LIHLFAPPTSVTKDAGKKCMIVMRKRKNPNSKKPSNKKPLSGFIRDKNHIINIANSTDMSCFLKKKNSFTLYISDI
jgi:hypothetical protein